MTGFCRRTGRSVRLVRTTIEVTVLLVGLLMGGSAGLGTVAYALAIGPLVQLFLPLFTVPEPAGAAAAATSTATAGTSADASAGVPAVRPASEPAAVG
jgi:hypothetical protein